MLKSLSAMYGIGISRHAHMTQVAMTRENLISIPGESAQAATSGVLSSSIKSGGSVTSPFANSLNK